MIPHAVLHLSCGMGIPLMEVTMKKCSTSFFFFGVGLIIVFSEACGSKNPVKPPSLLDLPDQLNTDVLVPLTVGNFWKYEYSVAKGLSRELVPSVTYTWRVFSDTLLNFLGQEYAASIIGSESPRAAKWFDANGEAGLYDMGRISFLRGKDGPDTLVTRSVWRKFPIAAGDSFQVKLFSFNHSLQKMVPRDTIQVKCLSTNEDFETPVGTFQCYVYQYFEKYEDVFVRTEYREYYAPGIGRIGWDSRDEGGDRASERAALMQGRVR